MGIGIIIRSYAKSEEVVGEVVSRAIKSARILSQLKCSPKILFVVPVDYDYGGTIEKLRNEFEKNDIPADVIGPVGHHSCEALNEGVKWMYDNNIGHVTILSNKAIGFVNDEVFTEVQKALEMGAKVVGIADDKLKEIVLTGRVQNTLAVWGVEALLELNPQGFDSETGVEEIAPSVRLIQKYGPCIAILEVAEGELNVRQSKDGQKRHAEVMNTKVNRQLDEVKRLGVTLDFIEKGIMGGYPKKIG